MLNRDCVVINPALQENGTALKALNLSGVRSWFTEGFDVGAYTELIAYLNVSTHVGGSGTLDVKLQGSADKVNWMDLGDAFTQVTTTDSQTLKRATSGFGKYMRVRIDLGGTTPNYTFSLYLVGK